MKKTNDNLMVITGIFITSLLTANVVAGKLVDLFGFIVPAAVVAYGITFLCTDVVGEIWGKEQAGKLVKIGVITQVLTLLLIFFAIKLPPAIFAIEYSEQFNTVMGMSARIVFASLVAYCISQFNDVYVFHKLKKNTKGKNKWIRNNVSTMSSQLIDTAIFITVAFYGVVPSILWMVLSQYIVKLAIALIDTPFFYLLTRNSKAGGEENEKRAWWQT